MATPRVDGDRLRDRFDRFNEIGATEAGGVNRPALTEANKAARDQLVDWLEAAGLTVTIDAMGNIFGRRDGRNPDAAPVLVGSHIDSQYNGGRYDGVVGALGALEVVETLNDAGVETEHPIEVVAWTNEEGVRFQPDLLGSGVFAGVFDLETAYAAADPDGRTLEAELERIGYKGETPCEPRPVECYLEIHVEQGPVLDEAGQAVGVVEGVYGFDWRRVRFEGQADHAGPTPMDARQDALVAAGDVVTAVRRLTATAGEDVVGTVGSLTVEPNSVNVIPETVALTVDIRSPDGDAIDDAVDAVVDEIAWAAARESVDVETEHLMRVSPTDFDPALVDRLRGIVAERGAEPLTMVSGAGHDASYLARHCPTAMLFVPSVDGLSHTEREFTEWTDVVTGVEVLCEAVRREADAVT